MSGPVSGECRQDEQRCRRHMSAPDRESGSVEIVSARYA